MAVITSIDLFYGTKIQLSERNTK